MSAVCRTSGGQNLLPSEAHSILRQAWVLICQKNLGKEAVSWIPVISQVNVTE